jgi:hypothetical protein
MTWNCIDSNRIDIPGKKRRKEGDHAKGLAGDHKPGGTEKGWRWRAGHPLHVTHGTMLLENPKNKPDPRQQGRGSDARLRLCGYLICVSWS